MGRLGSAGGGMAKGVATGAALGTMLGPGGAAVGAIYGGLIGGIGGAITGGGKSAEEKTWDQQEQARYQNCQNLGKAASNYFQSRGAERAAQGIQKTKVERPKCAPPRPYPGQTAAEAAAINNAGGDPRGFSGALDNIAKGLGTISANRAGGSGTSGTSSVGTLTKG